MPDPIPRRPFDQGLFLAHYNKGKEAFRAKQLDEAESQLEEAYLLRPRDVRVLNLLGLVYYRQEKLAKAEEVYRKLATDSPDAHTLHYNLGLICMKLDRLVDAESSLLKALELSQGKNPKIHFHLGSIYERTRRFKDAIYQYRQAGASGQVARVEGKLGPEARPAAPVTSDTSKFVVADVVPRTDTSELVSGEGGEAKPPATPKPDTQPPARIPPREALEPHPDDDAPEPTPEDEAAIAPPKAVEPVSPSILSPPGQPLDLNETARFQAFDDTLPPGRRRAPTPPRPSPDDTDPGPVTAPDREVFRCVEKGLLEVDFSGKVFLKQGTIYSYSGNLTFWVKEKRAKGLPALVIVTGTGRLLLTDQERDITLMQVDEDAIFVEPSRLLACEESLQPRYVRFGEGTQGVEVVVLEGRGMVALSVASKPLPLTVRPALPVSVPASSVIMWAGQLVPAIVEDPAVYEVVRPVEGEDTRLLRLEGTGRVLAEQAR
jgi:tetratricopeptide (TPR) repeat protein/uncharacterized protein (AIM24 family)